MTIDLESVFGEAGVLAQALPNYEFRASQLDMARAVQAAIDDREHLFVEAGTGTGKTLAYLIPALFSPKRVLISTATRNLQDQIFFKDIPFIQEHLCPQLSATYLKGRGNYLCLKRLGQARSQPQLFGTDVERVDQLSAWAESSESGERSEVPWMRDDDPSWGLLDARSDHCEGQRCSIFQDCFVTQARQKAVESDIVVINHALFFSNLALERDELGTILPDFGVLILDEAHEVETISSTHFGISLSSYQIQEFVRDFERAALADSGWGKRQSTRVSERAEALFGELPMVEGRWPLGSFPRPGYLADLRVELRPYCDRLQDRLHLLQHSIMSNSDGIQESEALARRASEILDRLERIFDTSSQSRVTWFERRPGGTFLYSTPIEVADILSESLFSRVETVVLTSATLATEGNFEYLRGRLGAGSSRELAVSSEFDFGRQSILYIPKNLPEPKSSDYPSRLVDEVVQILDITQGCAFLLTTSRQSMHRVHSELASRVPWPLLCQGEQPQARLLDTFRQTPGAVLVATSSFWQGVDVRGDALRAVLIDKLPFQVPTEPVVSARLKELTNRGEDPFYGYMVPSAVITLKQGLGRLIRSRQDQGLLAVLDSRLWTRPYGAAFLKSLPNSPVTDNISEIKNFFLRLAS